MSNRRYLWGIPNTLAPYRDEYGRFTSRIPVHCDSCQAVSINGTPCHESGCIRSGKYFDTESEVWASLVECSNCGFEYFDSANLCPECLGTPYCTEHDTYNCGEYHEEN